MERLNLVKQLAYKQYSIILFPINHLRWLDFKPSHNWKTSHHEVLTALQSAVDPTLSSGQFGPVGFLVRAVTGI